MSTWTLEVNSGVTYSFIKLNSFHFIYLPRQLTICGSVSLEIEKYNVLRTNIKYVSIEVVNALLQ